MQVNYLYISMHSLRPGSSPPSSLLVSVCKGVLGMIYCRCSHTYICTRLACRNHRLHTAFSGRCKTHGCSFGSSQTLAYRYTISEVCSALLVAARWRTHHDTTLGSSRNSDICLRPGRKKRIHCACYMK